MFFLNISRNVRLNNKRIILCFGGSFAVDFWRKKKHEIVELVEVVDVVDILDTVEMKISCCCPFSKDHLVQPE
jgi:hypothetical protein